VRSPETVPVRRSAKTLSTAIPRKPLSRCHFRPKPLWPRPLPLAFWQRDSTHLEARCQAPQVSLPDRGGGSPARLVVYGRSVASSPVCAPGTFPGLRVATPCRGSAPSTHQDQGEGRRPDSGRRSPSPWLRSEPQNLLGTRPCPSEVYNQVDAAARAVPAHSPDHSRGHGAGLTDR
jgi:hypothetical protein